MGLQIQVLNASTNREIDAAFATLHASGPMPSSSAATPSSTSRRMQLANAGGAPRVPATYSTVTIAEAGGLMSYGTNMTDSFRQVGVYTRPHPQGREARGLAGRAVVQIRVGHQRPDRQDARPQRAAVAARPRRRGDRVTVFFDALHMSAGLCRFSDAGMPRPSTRSGGRRPKSAKARNRGVWGTDGAAGAMGIWPRREG